MPNNVVTDLTGLERNLHSHDFTSTTDDQIVMIGTASIIIRLQNVSFPYIFKTMDEVP